MRRRRAFTLVEVVVAVSILGAGIALTLGLFAGGLNLASASGEYVKATLLAQQVMVERFATLTLAEGEEEGEEGQYKWSVSVERYYRDEGEALEAEPPIRLYEVSARVSWPGRMGMKTYELVSLRSSGGTEPSAATEEGTLTRTGRTTRTTPTTRVRGGRREGEEETPFGPERPRRDIRPPRE